MTVSSHYFPWFALLLAACGGPSVDRGELTRGVERALAAKKVCAADVEWKFPVRVRTDAEIDRLSLQALDALARRGLLTASAATATVPTFTLGPHGGTRTATVPAREFSLTTAGAAAYMTYPATGYGIVGAFCFGRREATVTSHKLSEGGMATVAFTHRLRDVPAWALDGAVQAHSPNLRRALATDTVSTHGTMHLVKTDSGWVQAGL
jgi:hypothetical protein